jgi:predicted TIM-barrel fold metal-dependent hydrolase
MKSSWRPSYSPPSPEADGDGGPQAVGLVDAHVHVFPPDMVQQREAYLGKDARFDALYRSPEARMATAEDVIAQMDPSGTAVSVIFGFAFKDQGLCRAVNDYVLEAVHASPTRLAGLACVAPGVSGAEAELEHCLDGGLRGCGELAPESADPDTIADLAPIADCLVERGLPLVVHSSEPVGHQYAGKGCFTPEACVALAKAYPGLTIVFAHLGGGLFFYELMPEVRKCLANAFYDTAAVPYLYEPGVYETAVSVVGPEKLLFGSDYPLLTLDSYLEGLERLSPEQSAAVRAGNARRVFGL